MISVGNKNVTSAGPDVVAVTGASGFIGSQIVSSLKEQGFPVMPISGLRSDDSKLPSRLDGALVGVHTVIHCAGSPVGPSYDDARAVDRFRADARAYTAALLKACRRQGVRRLMFTSSSKIYLPSDQLDVYAVTKYETEVKIREASDANFETICLRIPLVYGPQPKANFALLSKLSRIPFFPLPFGSIRNQQSFLSITNLSRAVVALLNTRKWNYQTLDIADPKPHSTPEILQFLAEANGNSKLTFMPFPLFLLRGICILLNKYSQFNSFSRDLTVKSNPVEIESAFPSLELLSTREAIHRYFNKEAS